MKRFSVKSDNRARGLSASDGAGNPPQRSARHRNAALWGVGLVLLAGTVCLSLFLGPASLSPEEIAGALTRRLGLGGPPQPSALRESILFQLRIPRILMAIIVGAGLSVAGAGLQATTRNDLAEPYLLGVSAGASAGAVSTLLVLPAAAGLGLTGGAALGALLSFGVLLLLLKGSRLMSTSVVLTGVLVGQFFQAITSLILMGKGDSDAVRGMTFWLMGALGNARSSMLGAVGLVVLVAGAVIWSQSRYLDVLAFGDETAASMGVPVTRVRAAVLVAVALMTAATVSAVGAIGFVGLIVPHAVRMVVGPQHRRLIPLCALAGAVLLVVTDALARSVMAPSEVPVGVFTALLGVPVFFVILRRKAKRA